MVTWRQGHLLGKSYPILASDLGVGTSGFPCSPTLHSSGSSFLAKPRISWKASLDFAMALSGFHTGIYICFRKCSGFLQQLGFSWINCNWWWWYDPHKRGWFYSYHCHRDLFCWFVGMFSKGIPNFWPLATHWDVLLNHVCPIMEAAPAVETSQTPKRRRLLWDKFSLWLQHFWHIFLDLYSNDVVFS